MLPSSCHCRRAPYAPCEQLFAAAALVRGAGVWCPLTSSCCRHWAPYAPCEQLFTAVVLVRSAGVWCPSSSLGPLCTLQTTGTGEECWGGEWEVSGQWQSHTLWVPRCMGLLPPPVILLSPPVILLDLIRCKGASMKGTLPAVQRMVTTKRPHIPFEQGGDGFETAICVIWARPSPVPVFICLVVVVASCHRNCRCLPVVFRSIGSSGCWADPCPRPRPLVVVIIFICHLHRCQVV